MAAQKEQKEIEIKSVCTIKHNDLVLLFCFCTFEVKL